MEYQTKQNNLLIPGSIVIAGVIIGGALYFALTANSASSIAAGPQPRQVPTGDLEQMAAITATDHVRGNPNAPVKIVEYSDTECPFCKRFHETMRQVMDTYGDNGQVAWVYRHFPLPQLHAKAPKEAEALECANELGGNDGFWKYANRLYEITPSNDGLDASELPKIAQHVGLDARTFSACLESGKYAQHVSGDAKNAAATGGNGTPWSIVVAANGKKYPLSGAQPYESVQQLIEIALREK